MEHTKRVAYQAGDCWGQALVPSPVLPSLQEWGWTLDEGIWKPFWTILPHVKKKCREVVQCGCKQGCQRRCSCTEAGLRCTVLPSAPARMTVMIHDCYSGFDLLNFNYFLRK